MKLTLTDKGLQALAKNQTVQLLDFIAGDSKSLSIMEKYVAGQSVGSNIFYQYGIEENHTYIKGDTYTPSDGGKPYKVENTFLELIGTLNCLSVPSSFVMYSLGIKAKIGENPPFIYAFGSISSSDKPYPINSGELISYITPVKIIYDNAPDVTTEESGVPWKNFIQHTDTYVSDAEGAHGLKIDPINLTMTVGETTISLAGGEERVAELEQEVQGILKYQASDPTIEYNDQLVLTVLTSADGDGTSIENAYKIRTPLDFWVVGTFKDSNHTFTWEGNTYYYPNNHYSLEANLDLFPLIGVKKKFDGYVSGNPTLADDLPEGRTENENAPCYNSGRGYEPWGLTTNNSTFDGKGHYIKNLYIGPDTTWNNTSYRKGGLFNRIGGANCTISNITLLDSRIIATPGGDCQVGSILSTTDDSGNWCVIRNCVSYAEIEKIGGNNGAYGGLVGKMSTNLGIYFCAFRGKFTDYTATNARYGFGGIAGWDGGSKVIGCYCDATITLNTDGYGGGIREHWLPESTDYVTGGNYYNGCYFAGSISNRWSNAQQNFYKYNSIVGQNYVGEPKKMVPLKFTFSLQGSTFGYIQGNARTREQMLSREFVDELNASLPANSEVSYVYVEGQFPKLSHEIRSIPTTAPLATIDTDTNYVLDSGLTVRDLVQTATQSNLNAVNLNLQSLLSQRYRVKVVNLTILTTDWNSSRRYFYYDDDLMFATSVNQVIPIPSGQDFIDHFVTCVEVGNREVSYVYRGYALFECASLPSTDLTFPVLILY